MRLSHEELTNLVYDRICKSPRYEWVEKNLPYTQNGVCGEWDVLAKVKGREIYHHYEIKTMHTSKTHRKAVAQFTRCAQKAYPDVEWKDIEIANGYCRRVKV